MDLDALKDHEKLKQLLEEGLDSNSVNPEGVPLIQTLLKFATHATGAQEESKRRPIEVLLEHGVDVNASGPQGTCLHALVYHFHASQSWTGKNGRKSASRLRGRIPSLWRLVVSAGANPDQPDSSGRTVWHLAHDLSVHSEFHSLLNE